MVESQIAAKATFPLVAPGNVAPAGAGVQIPAPTSTRPSVPMAAMIGPGACAALRIVDRDTRDLFTWSPASCAPRPARQSDRHPVQTPAGKPLGDLRSWPCPVQ